MICPRSHLSVKRTYWSPKKQEIFIQETYSQTWTGYSIGMLACLFQCKMLRFSSRQGLRGIHLLRCPAKYSPRFWVYAPSGGSLEQNRDSCGLCPTPPTKHSPSWSGLDHGVGSFHQYQESLLSELCWKDTSNATTLDYDNSISNLPFFTKLIEQMVTTASFPGKYWLFGLFSTKCWSGFKSMWI